MNATSDLVVAVEPIPSPAAEHITVPILSSYSRVGLLLDWTKDRFQRARELFAYIVLFLLIYAACYIIPYAFYDDYANLYTALTTGSSGDLVGPIENGRPILAFLYELAFGAMHDISDLRYLRLISVIGIALCAWSVFYILRRAGMNYWPAFFIPIAIFTLPTYQVFASWSMSAFHAYGILLAGAAWIMTERALASPRTKMFWICLPLAVILELCSMMIYQPAAMTFLLFGAVWLFVRNVGVLQLLRRLGVYLSVIAVAIALDDLSLHALPEIVLGVNVVSPRTGLVQDIAGKMVWFVQQPLNNALNVTSLVPSPTTSVLIAAFIASGLLLYFKGSVGSRVARVVLALSLLPISYLPNLVTIDNWAAYRTLVAMGSLIVLYYALAIIGFARLLEKVSQRQLTNAVVAVPLAVLAISGGLFAAHNVALDFAVPQYTELEFLTSQLQPVTLQHPAVIYFVPSDWTDSVAPIACYDEFGIPSSLPSWNSAAMVYLALQETDPADDHVQVHVISAQDVGSLPKGSVVVDMLNLKNLRSAVPYYCSTS